MVAHAWTGAKAYPTTCHAPLLLTLGLPFSSSLLQAPSLSRHSSHISPFPCSPWILSLLFNHQIPTPPPFSPVLGTHRFEQPTPNLSPPNPCRQRIYHVHFARGQGRCCWGKNWD